MLKRARTTASDSYAQYAPEQVAAQTYEQWREAKIAEPRYFGDMNNIASWIESVRANQQQYGPTSIRPQSAAAVTRHPRQELLPII